MKPINLLPLQVRNQHKVRKLAVSAVFGAMVGLLCVGMLYTTVKVEAGSVQAKVQEIQNAQAAQANKVAQAAAAANASSDSIRIQQLNLLAQTEINWDRALTKAGTIIPKDIKLSSFDYTVATGTVTLRLTGIAPSNVSFAVFMEFLKANTTFTGIKVEGYTYNPANGSVTFALNGVVPLSEINYSN